MSWRALMLVLVALLASGLVAAGCGGDDDDGDAPAVTITAPEGAGEEAQKQIEEGKEQGLEECKQAAENLSGEAKEQALDACESALGE